MILDRNDLKRLGTISKRLKAVCDEQKSCDNCPLSWHKFVCPYEMIEELREAKI